MTILEWSLKAVGTLIIVGMLVLALTVVVLLLVVLFVVLFALIAIIIEKLFSLCRSAAKRLDKFSQEQGLWKFSVSLLFRINHRLGLAYAERHRRQTEAFFARYEAQKKFVAEKTAKAIYRKQNKNTSALRSALTHLRNSYCKAKK